MDYDLIYSLGFIRAGFGSRECGCKMQALGGKSNGVIDTGTRLTLQGKPLWKPSARGLCRSAKDDKGCES